MVSVSSPEINLKLKLKDLRTMYTEMHSAVNYFASWHVRAMDELNFAGANRWRKMYNKSSLILSARSTAMILPVAA